MDLLSYYGLFLAKTLTVLAAIAVFAMILVNLVMSKRDQSEPGRLKITELNERYREMKDKMLLAMMKDSEKKMWHKARKKEEKQAAKSDKEKAKAQPEGENKNVSPKKTLYVIDFNGDVQANAVVSLREEISAILAVASRQDEVLLRLESPGGVVHGYGLAASQLDRLRKNEIKLTVSVDKVAASGGYMMACVANSIVSAPFAIIGSIGVVAQLPNFSRLLKRHDIDVELHTAGEYKRTLTLFGENTEQGREKFREELGEAHILFKQFVHEKRPSLDIDAVATGEHWFGIQAKEKGLVDALGTSDDLILAAIEEANVIHVHYGFRRSKSLIDRIIKAAAESSETLLLNFWQRSKSIWR